MLCHSYKGPVFRFTMYFVTYSGESWFCLFLVFFLTSFCYGSCSSWRPATVMRYYIYCLSYHSGRLKRFVHSGCAALRCVAVRRIAVCCGIRCGESDARCRAAHRTAQQRYSTHPVWANLNSKQQTSTTASVGLIFINHWSALLSIKSMTYISNRSTQVL